MKKTKIVCTIGPSSWSPEVLEKMVAAGMNVARINGAFADVPECKRVADLVRSISPEVALLMDIKGHEVRLNKFENNFNVEPGQEFIIGSSNQDAVYPVTYPELYQDIAVGQILFVDKGVTKLEVVKIADAKIHCKVLSGKIIASGKGMNTPGAHLKNPPITSRDIEQIKFAVEDGWDFIAASFVRNAEDIHIVKNQTKGSNIQIIAKIEDQQGVDNFDEIVKACDGIMIARGDMGSEMPYERLPILQKEMIYKCNKMGKPVITATNMLESMTENIMPTRAEMTDVANAVLDGTDAIMTSAETTAGKYPIETVEAMTKLATEAEKYLLPEILESDEFEDYQINVAISNAAFEFVLHLDGITKILVYTQTGVTARLLARLNLPMPIFALVSNLNLKHQLSLSKNVYTVEYEKQFNDRDRAVKEIVDFAFKNNIVNKDDKVLLIASSNHINKGPLNYPNLFEYLEMNNYVETE
jgi:pyruvate kinase